MFKLLDLELSRGAVATSVGIFKELRPVVRTTAFGQGEESGKVARTTTGKPTGPELLRKNRQDHRWTCRDRFTKDADVRRDDQGLLLDAERLPKRVRVKKSPTPS